MLNLALVIGTLAKEPQFRPVSGNTSVVSFDLQVAQEGQEHDVVPVTLMFSEDPDEEPALLSGHDYVVIGRVRRRFFRVGGTTRSRTEVVAHQVLRLDDDVDLGGALCAIEDALSVARSVIGSVRA